MVKGNPRRSLRKDSSRFKLKKTARHPPNKRFGQHFLVDPYTISRIIDSLQLVSTDTVVEIGAGFGALTDVISKQVKNVTAIEIDRDIAPILADKYPSIDIRQHDVLRIDASLFDGKRVVGNLPYNISTPLLNRLLTRPKIIDMHFMLQLEVADRITANPGSKSWGRLSVKTQYFCEAQKLFDVPPTAFSNPPQVESAFVRFWHRPHSSVVRNTETWERVVRMAFNQRRKKVSNSLKSLSIDWDRISVSPNLRADQIDVDGYVAIANNLTPHSSAE